MQSRNDRIANTIAGVFVVVCGSVALGFAALAVLYLRPGFDLVGLHPEGYLARVTFSIWLMIFALPFAGWAALVWHAGHHRLGSRLPAQHLSG